MIDRNTDTNQFEKILLYWWFIVLFIGTIIVGWTNISNEIKFQEARISALENRAIKVDSVLSQMASDVSFIRGRLEKQ